jgi:hypothetical protein
MRIVEGQMDDDHEVQKIIEAARKARDKLADIAINPAAYIPKRKCCAWMRLRQKPGAS